MASSYLLLGLCGFLLSCAVVDAQNAINARGGSGAGARYDDQVYIRGQQEGSYTVPGVGGSFQASSATGEHVYTDEQGNTYTHRKSGGRGAGSHSISGPGLVAQNVPAVQGQRRVRSPQFHVSRPDRTVDVGSDGSFLAQRRIRSPQFHVSRPDRRVDVGSDGSFLAQRRARSPQIQASRPGQTVYYEPGSEIHLHRPGHSIDISDGNVLVHRQSRSPHHHPDHHGTDHTDVETHDHAEHSHGDEHKRVRRARVQGENFVARDNQAGVFKDGVSVWKRPDGRTVTVDAQGNVITSGSPNGRGPQYYPGRR